MKTILLGSLLIFSIGLNAQTIIPEPFSMKTVNGVTKFKKPLRLLSNNLENETAYLTSHLKELYNWDVEMVSKKTQSDIILQLNEKLQVAEEEYNLNTTKKPFLLEAKTPTGIFRGIQSFIQLLDPKNTATPYFVPKTIIQDKPRFSYRGMHLDVARHFFSVAFVKKYIDWLAFHKFNYFHWHLTDDQGWRIEIKSYPKLISVASTRKGTVIGRYFQDKPFTLDSIPHRGFYTQEEIKEVVMYAAKKHITVVPEIEMPGHALAVLAAYPDLGCEKKAYEVGVRWGVYNDVFCAGNDTVFTFLQNVLDEVIALFPFPFIHIGGDECPKDAWKKCPKCQRRIKNEKLKDEVQLQSYFVKRVERYLNSKGKNIIGWDEVLEGGIDSSAVIMSWRGTGHAVEEATKNGNNVIMTPNEFVYFDHAESKQEDSLTIGGFTSLEEVYNYEPVPAHLNLAYAKKIIGAQANVWTEYMPNTKKIQYMIFPRMSAMAEVVWANKKDWANFAKKMPMQVERYKLLGIHFNPSFLKK